MWGVKETWRDHGFPYWISVNVALLQRGNQFIAGFAMQFAWKVYCDVKKCGSQGHRKDHGRCIAMSRNVGSQGDMERSWKVYCDVKKCGVSRRHGEIMVFPIGLVLTWRCYREETSL